MIIPIKEDIVTYCRIVLDNHDKYAIADVESTGFDKNEVINLGIADPNGTTLYDGLFKPKYPVEPGAEAVHHISMAMLANAPSFSGEWPKIYEAIKDRIIITYNAKFDAKCIAITAGIHKIALPDITYQCFMLKYADYWDAMPKPGKYNAPYQKLELACAQQGIDIGQQEHRALSDTLATLALIKRIAELGPATRKYSEASTPWPSMVSLDEMLSLQRPHRQETTLKLIDTSQSVDDVAPSDSPFNANLVDFNVCCKCGKRASLLSLSGGPQSAYCDEHGKSQCGQHTIADFVYCYKRKIWLDPCIANKDVIEKPKQQSLLLVS